ncbi:MAG: hypothetical protein Ct9H300mP28_20260 [Pseudomonadota bacterium]|nr:MAG: hypothetical protein Ct9H300mP28_20260 [Pseudomonadota bacterium]
MEGLLLLQEIHKIHRYFILVQQQEASGKQKMEVYFGKMSLTVSLESSAVGALTVAQSDPNVIYAEWVNQPSELMCLLEMVSTNH